MQKFISTPMGVRQVTHQTTEVILLNYYGEGVHETLNNALFMADTLDGHKGVEEYEQQTVTIFYFGD